MLVVLFLYTKLIDCFLSVSFSWLQTAARKIWMVRSIWELLCLEANCAAAREGSSMLSLDASQEVAGVHLQTWLCGVNLHGAAAHRILDLSSETQLAFLFLVQYIVMVVALTVLDLLVVCIDVLTDGFGVRKSNGVPSTLRISPVGIDTLSIGR